MDRRVLSIDEHVDLHEISAGLLETVDNRCMVHLWDLGHGDEEILGHKQSSIF